MARRSFENKAIAPSENKRVCRVSATVVGDGFSRALVPGVAYDLSDVLGTVRRARVEGPDDEITVRLGDAVDAEWFERAPVDEPAAVPAATPEE